MNGYFEKSIIKSVIITADILGMIMLTIGILKVCAPEKISQNQEIHTFNDATAGYCAAIDLNYPTAEVKENESEVVESTEDEQQEFCRAATEEEIELMARIVEAEAGNQGMIGKQLVADVILNRVSADCWADTITGVIKQRNAFTTYKNGRYKQITPTEETYDAVLRELDVQKRYDIYYFTANHYGRYGTPLFFYKDHYFCGR